MMLKNFGLVLVWRRRFGFGLIFLCIWLVQTATCEERPAVDVAPHTVISSVSTVSVSSTSQQKPEKQKKYVVVDVAEKDLSPEAWKSWTPMPDEPITVLEATSPSTPTEAEKRGSFQEKKKQEIGNMINKDKKKHNGAKPSTDDWSIDRLQKQVFSYGKMLLDNFINGLESSAATAAPSPSKTKAAKVRKVKSNPAPDQATAASASAPFPPHSHYNGGYGFSSVPAPPNSNSHYSAIPALDTYYNYGSSFGESKSVVNWLSRLIGVSGKTLGEFLREYQVHVLYDLVFTFFKWIFFLYAGLLIP